MGNYMSMGDFVDWLGARLKVGFVICFPFLSFFFMHLNTLCVHLCTLVLFFARHC